MSQNRALPSATAAALSLTNVSMPTGVGIGTVLSEGGVALITCGTTWALPATEINSSAHRMVTNAARALRMATSGEPRRIAPRERTHLPACRRQSEGHRSRGPRERGANAWHLRDQIIRICGPMVDRQIRIGRGMAPAAARTHGESPWRITKFTGAKLDPGSGSR